MEIKIDVNYYKIIGELYVKLAGQAEIIKELQAENERLRNGLPDLISVEDATQMIVKSELAEGENGQS